MNGWKGQEEYVQWTKDKAMADQTFLELVRKYLWRYLLWKSQNGYMVSYEDSHKALTDHINYALRGEYYNNLGTHYKEQKRRALEILDAHATEVREVIEELHLKLDKKNAKEDVNRITARAILEPLLDEVGMKYYIEYQKTGVKINVQLLPKKKGQLYMSYSKVRKECDKLISNILSLKQMYEYFGHNSGIINISKEETEKFK